jgi:type VI secretion system FHA domain protein
MPLVLSVLRCPDQSVPEQRRVQGGEYVLGRGTECDWVLRDPDRVLSKRHCVVEFFSGGWQVRDVSTNGTFVNGGSEAVGRDLVRALRDGDRLRLGAYEIECRVEDEASYGSGRWQAANAMPDPMAPPPVSDIFSVPLPGLSPAGGPPQGNAPLLPADFDPFAPEDSGPVMPDHRPSTNDVFTPPRAMMPDLLPQDWNAPTPAQPGASPPDPFAHLPDPFADTPPAPLADPGRPGPKLPDPFAELAPPGAPPPAQKLADPFADLGLPSPPQPSQIEPSTALPVTKLPDPFADLAPPGAPTPVERLPDPFADLAPFADAPTPAASPSPMAPAALPLATLEERTGGADPFAEPHYPSAPLPAHAQPALAEPVAAAVAQPQPGLAVPATPQPVPADALLAALGMIHAAAGLNPPAPGTDAAAALTAVGAGMRAAVAGLRGLLIARADVKREFRIEQTMLRAAGNNTPVVMLSALASLDERVRGLRAGSDDYVTKPFELPELLARLEAVQRRASTAPGDVTRLVEGELELDLLARRVTWAGRRIELQPREFRLLEYLVRHRGHVVTRSMLLEGVWDYHFDPGTNVIDVHVSRLRKKLDEGGAGGIVETVRGAGYRVAGGADIEPVSA